MGKVLAKKPVATEQVKMLVKQSAVASFDDVVELSWDNPLDDLVFLVYGVYGAGKTTFASTASEFFPKDGLPTKRWTGPKPKYVLEDMFWLSFDKKATAGFRERGIAVREFSIPRFRSREALWSKAGFKSPPTLRQAVDFGLNLAATAHAKYGAKWIVADTLSTFDADLEVQGRKTMKTSKRTGEPDTREMYGRVFFGHKVFYDEIRLLDMGVILLAHAKSIDDRTKMLPDERNRLITLTAAGVPDILPAITGKGQGVYKGDPAIEFALIAKVDPGGGGKLVREVHNLTGGIWEGKNRYELSIDPVEPPNFRHILAKISQ